MTESKQLTLFDLATGRTERLSLTALGQEHEICEADKVSEEFRAMFDEGYSHCKEIPRESKGKGASKRIQAPAPPDPWTASSVREFTERLYAIGQWRSKDGRRPVIRDLAAQQLQFLDSHPEIAESEFPGYRARGKRVAKLEKCQTEAGGR